MKKTAIGVLLSLALCSTLITSCSDKGSNTEESTPPQSSAEHSEPAPESSDAPDAALSLQSFERGSVVGNTYTSTFAGMSLKMPEDWHFISDQEILKLTGLKVDANDPEAVREALLKQDVIYDAMILNADSSCNIIIGYESIAKKDKNPAEYTADDYIREHDEKISADLTATYHKTATEDVTLGGVYFKKVTYVVSRSFGNITQVYYLREAEGFMQMILVTAKEQTELPDFTQMISEL